MNYENNENESSYQVWKASKAETIESLVKQLDFDGEFALKELLIDAYFEGHRAGIDGMYQGMRNLNE